MAKRRAVAESDDESGPEHHSKRSRTTDNSEEEQEEEQDMDDGETIKDESDEEDVEDVEVEEAEEEEEPVPEHCVLRNGKVVGEGEVDEDEVDGVRVRDSRGGGRADEIGRREERLFEGIASRQAGYG